MKREADAPYRFITIWQQRFAVAVLSMSTKYEPVRANSYW